MRTRRFLSFTLAVSLVFVAGANALHATINQYQSRPLDRQNIGHIVGTRDTHATNWTSIGGWSFSDGMVIQANGAIAATLSVTISGAPVDFRIVMELPQQEYAQRAVVASRVGGIQDQIVDGRSGLLIEPTDLSSLGRSLSSLIADLGFAQAIGHAARERVRARYLPPHFLGAHLGVIDRILREVLR